MAHASNHQCACAQVAPTSDKWVDILRWCICTLPNDDDDMSFIASLFSYAHHNGGLTDKQARAASNVVRRIVAEKKK